MLSHCFPVPPAASLLRPPLTHELLFTPSFLGEISQRCAGCFARPCLRTQLCSISCYGFTQLLLTHRHNNLLPALYKTLSSPGFSPGLFSLHAIYVLFTCSSSWIPLISSSSHCSIRFLWPLLHASKPVSKDKRNAGVLNTSPHCHFLS